MTGRKWLAAVAVLVVVETIGVALSPLLCPSGTPAVIAAGDCCPPGSHPNGLCPMHKPGAHASDASARRALPRWTCSCTPATVVLLLVAPLPHPPVIVVPRRVSVAPTMTRGAALDGLSVPASPPPRS